MRKKQVTAYLTNEVGAMAKAAKALAAAKVNIEGISVVENADTGVVRMVVSNVVAAKKALGKARIGYTVQDVEVVPLCDRPGALAVATAKLAKARVNINYMYGTVCDCDCDCKCDCNCACGLVVSASDLKKVRAILK